ncbi:MAG: hypothetical protein FWD54_06655 [Endomicrobia bacterium]|nr:hypothetical protein [Endomicrobiia bacterium]
MTDKDIRNDKHITIVRKASGLGRSEGGVTPAAFNIKGEGGNIKCTALKNEP